MTTFEVVSAVSTGIVGLGTIAVGVTSRRTRRQERRDDFTAVQAAVQKYNEGLESRHKDLGEKVERLEQQIDEEREGRRKDRRTMDALLRYVRKLLATLRDNDIDPPAPDSGDEPELASHGIP